ncbi:MAG TPA: hypothetical protein VGG74_18135 [Kofleriaceae bacterium]|jgi:hypothetical protein
MRYALLLVVVSAGCAAQYSQVAATHFSSTYACPSERISSLERKDLHTYSNTGALALTVFPDDHPPPTPPAPADVRRDPERLKLWVQQNTPQISGDHVVTATGCGHDATYICDDPTTDTPYTSCLELAP